MTRVIFLFLLSLTMSGNVWAYRLTVEQAANELYSFYDLAVETYSSPNAEVLLGMNGGTEQEAIFLDESARMYASPLIREAMYNKIIEAEITQYDFEDEPGSLSFIFEFSTFVALVEFAAIREGVLKLEPTDVFDYMVSEAAVLRRMPADQAYRYYYEGEIDLAFESGAMGEAIREHSPGEVQLLMDLHSNAILASNGRYQEILQPTDAMVDEAFDVLIEQLAQRYGKEDALVLFHAIEPENHNEVGHANVADATVAFFDGILSLPDPLGTRLAIWFYGGDD